MSKIFYDQYVELAEVEKKLKKVANSHEEKIEFWEIIDEIIHHRVMGCIFDKLPEKHHKEFIRKVKENPFSDDLVVYLSEKIKEDIAMLIRFEVKKLEMDLLKYFSEDTGKPN